MKKSAKNNITVKELVDRYKKGERDFSGTVLTDAAIDGFDLKDIVLKKSDLSYSSFIQTNLKGANLTGTDMTWSKLSYTNLTNAKMVGVILRWALLEGVYIDNADLTRADLSWSRIDNTNLSAAKLAEANIGWASLRKVMVTSDQIPQKILQTLKTDSVKTKKGEIESPGESLDAYGSRQGHDVYRTGSGTGTDYLSLVTGQVGDKSPYAFQKKNKKDAYSR